MACSSFLGGMQVSLWCGFYQTDFPLTTAWRQHWQTNGLQKQTPIIFLCWSPHFHGDSLTTVWLFKFWFGETFIITRHLIDQSSCHGNYVVMARCWLEKGLEFAPTTVIKHNYTLKQRTDFISKWNTQGLALYFLPYMLLRTIHVYICTSSNLITPCMYMFHYWMSMTTSIYHLIMFIIPSRALCDSFLRMTSFNTAVELYRDYECSGHRDDVCISLSLNEVWINKPVGASHASTTRCFVWTIALGRTQESATKQRLSLPLVLR